MVKFVPRAASDDEIRQEPWKLPLPDFIERIYLEGFRKSRPDKVLSIEERARLQAEKKSRRRAAKPRPGNES